MGVIICKKHGQQGINLVPPALRQAVLDEKPLPRDQVHKVKFVFDGEEGSWWWCDKKSIKRYSIPLNRVLTEDEYFTLSEQILSEPVCYSCLEEWLSNSGWGA